MLFYFYDNDGVVNHIEGSGVYGGDEHDFFISFMFYNLKAFFLVKNESEVVISSDISQGFVFSGLEFHGNILIM